MANNPNVRNAMPTKAERQTSLSAMRAKIHIAKKELAMEDDDYRSFMLRTVGADSSRRLNYGELTRVLEAFKTELGWTPKPFKKARGKQARMIWAIWGDLRKAKLVRETSPRKFVRKMTGKDDPDFLSPAEANTVIEALKAMRTRADLASESIGPED